MSWAGSARFFESLRAVLNSGMPMMRALELSGEAAGEPYRRLARQWAANCAQGTALSDAMRASAQSALIISLIKAGEASGRLTDICAEIASYYRHMATLRQMIAARLAYPVLLLHVALVVVAVPTVFLAHGSFLWFLAGPAALWLVLLACVVAYRCAPADALARLLLAPGFAWVVLPLLAGTTCLIVRAGLTAGMNIPASLELAADACGNRRMAARLHEASRQVLLGALPDLTAAFRVCAMPPEVIALTGSGEVSGTLDATLQRCTLMQLEDFRQRTQWAGRLATGVIYGLAVLISVAVIMHVWSSIYGALGMAANGIE